MVLLPTKTSVLAKLGRPAKSRRVIISGATFIGRRYRGLTGRILAMTV